MKTKNKTQSLRQKAKSIGISPSHYCGVISGKVRPSLTMAQRIAPLEGRHFLNLMDPSGFDERGRPRKTQNATEPDSPTDPAPDTSWTPPPIPSRVKLSAEAFTCVSCGAVCPGPQDPRRTAPDSPASLFTDLHRLCPDPFTGMRRTDEE